MGRRQSSLDLALLQIDQQSPTPRYLQIVERLRDAIGAGQLAAGARLPSTRDLAAALRVSRITAISAYDLLLAEGYLEARSGAGTYVAPGAAAPAAAASPATPEELGPFGARLPRGDRPSLGGSWPAQPLQPNLPDLRAAPTQLWGRLVAAQLRSAGPHILGYSEPAGHPPLRAAIARYLGVFRGVRCGPEQVIITSGSQQAIDLVLRVLLRPGDTAWVEHPSYTHAQALIHASQIQIAWVPVDAEGARVADGVARAPHARLAYVTPGHQMPTGATLSPARRAELLAWAAGAGAWVLEDDYDSEYRYDGRPAPAMQGMDRHGRVIYIGTFSKTLFPALRIGYLVAPPGLAEAFATARSLVDRQSSAIDQAALAELIQSGSLARHIRLMRGRYAARRRILIDALRRQLGGRIEIAGDSAGLQIVAWLPPGVSDQRAAQAARQAGVAVGAISDYAPLGLERGGLMIGFAPFDEPAIRSGVAALAAAIQHLL